MKRLIQLKVKVACLMCDDKLWRENKILTINDFMVTLAVETQGKKGNLIAYAPINSTKQLFFRQHCCPGRRQHSLWGCTLPVAGGNLPEVWRRRRAWRLRWRFHREHRPRWKPSYQLTASPWTLKLQQRTNSTTCCRIRVARNEPPFHRRLQRYATRQSKNLPELGSKVATTI